jgi:hypothetical protein
MSNTPPRNRGINIHPTLNALLKDRVFIDTIFRLLSSAYGTSVRLKFMANDFDFFEFEIFEYLNDDTTTVEWRGFTNAGTPYRQSFRLEKFTGEKRIPDLERKLKMIDGIIALYTKYIAGLKLNKNTKAYLVGFDALLRYAGREFDYMPAFQRIRKNEAHKKDLLSRVGVKLGTSGVYDDVRAKILKLMYKTPTKGISMESDFNNAISTLNVNAVKNTYRRWSLIARSKGDPLTRNIRREYLHAMTMITNMRGIQMQTDFRKASNTAGYNRVTKKWINKGVFRDNVWKMRNAIQQRKIYEKANRAEAENRDKKNREKTLNREKDNKYREKQRANSEIEAQQNIRMRVDFRAASNTAGFDRVTKKWINKGVFRDNVWKVRNLVQVEKNRLRTRK